MIGTDTKVAGQHLGAGILNPARSGMGPEHSVLLSLFRDLAGPQGQEVPDEGIEVFLAVSFETALDGVQVIGVEPFLALPAERHQDEVADHVGAGQVAAAGVHGLEDALRVVLPLELEGDDAQLAQARAQRRDVRTQLLDPFLEQREGLKDAHRRGGGQGPVMDQRQQGLRIPRLEDQAVVMVPLAEGIEKVVVPDLLGLEAVRRGVLVVPGQSLQDQADGGQALLAVIDQVGRPVGVEGIDGGDIHHRAEEMLAHLRALAGVLDVLPELPAFLLGPGVAALVDGDAELGGLPDEIEEKGFRGAHGMLRVGGTGRGPGPLRASRDCAPPDAPLLSSRCAQGMPGNCHSVTRRHLGTGGGWPERYPSLAARPARPGAAACRTRPPAARNCAHR